MHHGLAEQRLRRSLKVFDWRRIRIAAHDRDDLDGADLALAYCRVHRAVARIEAAVKGHEHGCVGVRDVLEARPRTLEVEIEGLFAEHRLAGAHRARRQLGVGAGARADDHRVRRDTEGGVGIADGIGAVLCGQTGRRVGVDVGDVLERGFVARRDVPCVKAPCSVARRAAASASMSAMYLSVALSPAATRVKRPGLGPMRPAPMMQKPIVTLATRKPWLGSSCFLPRRACCLISGARYRGPGDRVDRFRTTHATSGSRARSPLG